MMEKEYVALSRAHGALNGGPANQVSQLTVKQEIQRCYSHKTSVQVTEEMRIIKIQLPSYEEIIHI